MAVPASGLLGPSAEIIITEHSLRTKEAGSSGFARMLTPSIAEAEAPCSGSMSISVHSSSRSSRERFASKDLA
eukprot:7387187-Lingulodinium_polyedra.AAC.1